MKNVNRKTLVLFGLCAVIWIVKIIMESVDALYAEHPIQFALDGVCVVLWIICFFVTLKNVRQNKEE